MKLVLIFPAAVFVGGLLVNVHPLFLAATTTLGFGIVVRALRSNTGSTF